MVVAYHYNGAQWYEQFLQIASGFDLAWFSSASSEHLCIFGLHGAMYIEYLFWFHSPLYLLVS